MSKDWNFLGRNRWRALKASILLEKILVGTKIPGNKTMMY